MKVFKLEIDCAKCMWVGMALVAAVSYNAAVSEYAKNGLSGEFVQSGEIVFTKDSENPLDGIVCGKTKVLCEVMTYDC